MEQHGKQYAFGKCKGKTSKIIESIADKSETYLNFIINKHKWILCIIMLENTWNKWLFWYHCENNCSTLVIKTCKGHGKSWNVKSVKECEPCHWISSRSCGAICTGKYIDLYNTIRWNYNMRQFNIWQGSYHKITQMRHTKLFAKINKQSQYWFSWGFLNLIFLCFFFLYHGHKW